MSGNGWGSWWLVYLLAELRRSARARTGCIRKGCRQATSNGFKVSDVACGYRHAVDDGSSGDHGVEGLGVVTCRASVLPTYGTTASPIGTIVCEAIISSSHNSISIALTGSFARVRSIPTWISPIATADM